jgi:hypothetical protein
MTNYSVNQINASRFIENAKTGDTVVVELARRDNEEGTAPDWHKPQTETIYVQRRDKPFKGRGSYGKSEPKGYLLILTLQNGSWAEYRMDDWSPEFATFNCEEYYMHVISWNGNAIDNPQTV